MAIFTARRLDTDSLSIISRWYDPAGEPLCFCLEPGLLREPNAGIPAGIYNLRLRAAGAKHAEYNKYYAAKFGIGWHKGMVEICNVPDRDFIEFHVGNTIADTLGCSLAGTSSIAPPGNGSGHWEVSGSRAAYERVYPILRDAITADATHLQILFIGSAHA
jgi:hypothetical protein